MKRQSPIDEVLPLPHKKVKPQSPVDTQEDYEIPLRQIGETEWFAVDEFEVFQVRKLVTN
ncbi:917_t:CDS:2, partial [Racocetra persica]